MRKLLIPILVLLTLMVGTGLGFVIALTSLSSFASEIDCPTLHDCNVVAIRAIRRGEMLSSSTTSTTSPVQTTTVPTTVSTTTTTLPSGNPVPLGVPGSWRQTLSDEFNGTSLDRTKWVTSGNFLCCDGGRSQKTGANSYNNGQLEYMTDGANLSFSGGAMTITAKRETAPNGGAWTSGQVVSKQSFTYGYIETRATLPALKGFQPSLWTWAVPGSSAPNHDETDGYEYYSDNHTKLYLTSHAGSGGSCTITPSFDPSTGMHVYGVNIQPDGTSWYIDGNPVCVRAGHPTANGTNIIDYLAVLQYPRIQPSQQADPSTVIETHTVDYIRSWVH